jgi:hypothetical protein
MLLAASMARPPAIAAFTYQATPAAPLDNPGGRMPDYLGSASCSSTACHGRVAPLSRSESPSARRDEHTTWISRDPHSHAFSTLFDPRSVSIAEKLAGPNGLVVPAHEDARCLACHTTPRPVELLAHPSPINDDGVGCESCHGPASLWLGPHTSPAWQAFSPAEQESRFGFLNTTDPSGLASNCAGCHVGSRLEPGLADRDVNHDLIAAGHPRLAFEFSAFLDLYPKHWDPKPTDPDPVLAWSVGQKAVLERTLSLTRDRAQHPDAPWPEFAEYGCFSCHHRLADEPWRLKAESLDSPPGVPSWSSWALAPDRGAYVASALPLDTASGPLGQLRILMQGFNIDRPAISAAARAALEEVASRPIGLASPKLADQVRLLDAPSAWREVGSWDDAAQRYLALAACYRSMGDSAPVDLRERLETLRRQLAFPAGRDSPAGFDPAILEPRGAGEEPPP